MEKIYTKIMSRNEERLDTIIGKMVRIKGDITTDSGLRLDGQIEGNVDVGSILITGKGSLIKGDIRCKEAIIGGRIEGNISASNAVEMQTGASIFGDVHCKSLIIQKDCFFEGKCQMVERKEELVTV
jgi:cytoskeletal protein CcmA (bactofilin family)